MNETEIERKLNVFERYLSLWVILCIAAGIIIGKVAPKTAKFLDGLAIYVNESPMVSIPIAICMFFMMYPIMVKIDFSNVIKSGKRPKPIGLTLFANWAIKLLIARGAAVDVRTHDGSAKTPLHMAAETGHLDIARFLLDRGSKIDETAKGSSYQDWTPLHFAAAELGRANTAKVLIAHGADVNNQLNIIGTPFHISARKGHEKVAAVLIDNGVDVDAVNLKWDSYRPLYFAA